MSECGEAQGFEQENNQMTHGWSTGLEGTYEEESEVLAGVLSVRLCVCSVVLQEKINTGG